VDTKLTSKDFLFNLPPERIAQKPAEKRGSSKLLVYKEQTISASVFEKLHTVLPEKAVIVRNHSKVFQARLFFESEHGGQRELFFVKKISCDGDSSMWQVLAKPLKKIKKLNHISLPGDVTARITQTLPAGLIIEMPMGVDQVYSYLEEHGSTPLPPYIKREEQILSDKQSYQNTYSKEFGSAAAPTAGLHMTSAYAEHLAKKQVEFVDVELCVGGGTFLPVTSETPDQHTMHAEQYFVSEDAASRLRAAKQNGIPIFALGTTSFRATEDLFSKDKESDEWNSTELFIYPKTQEDRYRSVVFDGIITNFHQPDSTLIMLMAGLLGLQAVQRCYQFALGNDFRFLSYGDSGIYYL